MSFEQLDLAFNPRSIAIVGASDTPPSWGHVYLQGCTQYGYQGQIYPVNPKKNELFGLKCYSSLQDIPGSVDYVISCLAAASAPDVISDCRGKGVKMVHFIAIDFDRPTTEETLRRARALGIRILGPNCLGLYNPGAGISFGFDFPREQGRVGLFVQSGGIPNQLVRYAAARGIRFSKVFSYGNGDDTNEADLLEYLRHDPETDVIACYLEGARNGKKFFQQLQQTTPDKPVIVLKAGRSSAGAQAAASHTAALAGSLSTWNGALKQANAVAVATLEELTDMMVAFSFAPPVKGRSLAIVGGSGGRSVLSADAWGEAGFDILPVPSSIAQKIKHQFPENKYYGWIKNPVDVSDMPLPNLLGGAETALLELMGKSSQFDLLSFNIAVESPFEKDIWISLLERQVSDVLRLKEEINKPLLGVLSLPAYGAEELDNWRWRFLAQQKTRLIEARVPLFLTISEAAAATGHLASYWKRRNSL
jgi:acyl-CoA synthetase (NDP forming)